LWGDAGMDKSQPSSTAQTEYTNHDLGGKYVDYKLEHCGDHDKAVFRLMAEWIEEVAENITGYYVRNKTLDGLKTRLPKSVIRDLVFILTGLTKIQPKSFSGRGLRSIRSWSTKSGLPPAGNGGQRRTGSCHGLASTSDN